MESPHSVIDHERSNITNMLTVFSVALAVLEAHAASGSIVPLEPLVAPLPVEPPVSGTLILPPVDEPPVDEPPVVPLMLPPAATELPEPPEPFAAVPPVPVPGPPRPRPFSGVDELQA
jgi:hypothetical protein